MAMPMNNDGMDPDEGGAERTSNVTDYKRTCIDFIAVSYTHLTLPTKA